jgi:hypothetical protein
MDLFRKTLVPLGKHVAPEGEVEVTPERAARWVKQFNQMRARGIRLPVPFGHRLAAEPIENEFDDEEKQRAAEEAALARAKWNSGYIEDLSIDPHTGAVMFSMKPPPGMNVDGGDLVDPINHTRIGEVSAGIGDWTDGRNRVWRDCIFHAALTPLPVVAGQDEMILPVDSTVSSMLATGQSRIVWRHQLSTRTGETSMAKDKEKEPEEEGKKKKKADDALDEDIAATIDLPPEPKKGAGESDECFSRVLSLLKEEPWNIQLPDDVDKKDFFQMFEVALMNAKPAETEPAPPVEPPPETSPTPDTSGAVPESPPIMMATKDGKTVALSDREKKSVYSLGRRERERLLVEAESLATLGVPPSFVEEFRGRIARQSLSLNPETMQVSMPVVAGQIGALKRILSAMNPDAALLLKTLSTAQPEARPDRVGSADYGNWLEQEAERLYGKGAKPAKVA